MTSFVALMLAAAAVVALATSALSGAVLASVRLERLTPAAQSRLLLALALLPAFATCAALLAALAPSFGWIADHCEGAVDPHNHPHICAAHHVASVPAMTVILLGALLAGRVSFGVLRTARAGFAAALLRRELERLSGGRGLGSAHILPLEEPQALSVGLIRAAVFVSEGLVSGDHRQHLEPVLAHEHAHARRLHSLRRLLAGMGLAFHLPGIAGAIERRLARAHEMQADADAASLVGADRVATAVVRLARVRSTALRGALGFGGSDVEARVETLLDPGIRRDQPGARLLLALAGAIGVVFGIGADSVHHGLEMMLGLLGG